MKRITVIIIMVIMAVTMTAQAETVYAETYNIDTMHYIACAIVNDECTTVVVDIFGLADLAETNSVCSAYAVDCDGLYKVDWSFNGDVFTTYEGYWYNGSFIRTGEIEYVD